MGVTIWDKLKQKMVSMCWCDTRENKIENQRELAGYMWIPAILQWNNCGRPQTKAIVQIMEGGDLLL